MAEHMSRRMSDRMSYGQDICQKQCQLVGITRRKYIIYIMIYIYVYVYISVISVIHIIYYYLYIYIHIRVLVVISSDQDLHQDFKNGRLLIRSHSGLFGHEILPKNQWELWWYNIMEIQRV